MNERTRIYFDGTCSMCRIFAERAAAHTTTLDVTEGNLPNGITRDQAMAEIYAVDPAGTTHTGADAILHILDHYWYWRPAVWIARLPGFIQIARYIYRIVARYRHGISW